MKRVQNTLISISDALQKLSKQFRAASKELDKLKKAPAKKTKAKKAVKSKAKPAKAASVIDAVFGVIKKTRKGVTISEIKDKTKLESRQISNAVYKLSKRGQIKTKTRGVYVKK